MATVISCKGMNEVFCVVFLHPDTANNEKANTKLIVKIFFFFFRRGPMRYRFQGLYELDSLAVVNVRDAGPVKNAFKILMFPETRMYQADSAKSKVSLVYTGTPLWKQDS